MRTEKEIYDLVLNFAFQDERIRIVTLEGSRTNVNIPKDNLQDYDITFFVIDMGEFLKSDDWLSVFGNRIMMQKPEDMELFPPEEKGFAAYKQARSDMKELHNIKANVDYLLDVPSSQEQQKDKQKSRQ